MISDEGSIAINLIHVFLVRIWSQPKWIRLYLIWYSLNKPYPAHLCVSLGAGVAEEAQGQERESRQHPPVSHRRPRRGRCTPSTLFHILWLSFQWLLLHVLTRTLTASLALATWVAAALAELAGSTRAACSRGEGAPGPRTCGASQEVWRNGTRTRWRQLHLHYGLPEGYVLLYECYEILLVLWKTKAKKQLENQKIFSSQRRDAHWIPLIV